MFQIIYAIYFIFALYSIFSSTSSIRRALKIRWERVMDINNVDYDSELKPSIAVLRRISTDTHIKDSYLRLLARRLYLHKLVVYSAVLGYIILLFIACITFY